VRRRRKGFRASIPDIHAPTKYVDQISSLPLILQLVHIAEIAELGRLVGVSQLCTTRAKLYGNSRAGNTNLRPLSFALSISVNATRARKIADGELDLESADRAVVPKVRARLGRVVAGEDDCHR
jgi:hypothetical protein